MNFYTLYNMNFYILSTPLYNELIIFTNELYFNEFYTNELSSMLVISPNKSLFIKQLFSSLHFR